MMQTKVYYVAVLLFALAVGGKFVVRYYFLIDFFSCAGNKFELSTGCADSELFCRSMHGESSKSLPFKIKKWTDVRYPHVQEIQRLHVSLTIAEVVMLYGDDQMVN